MLSALKDSFAKFAFKAFVSCNKHRLKNLKKKCLSIRAETNSTLRQILDACPTVLWKELNLKKIRDYDEFKKKITIFDYEAIREYLAPDKLLFKPVLMFKTSGTTGNPKYIPISSEALNEYRFFQIINTVRQLQIINDLFVGGLFAIRGSLIEGFYGGIPYGSMSGAFFEVLHPLVKFFSATRGNLFFSDYQQKLLNEAVLAMSKQVSCIATANPTTLLTLVSLVKENKDLLVDCFKHRSLVPLKTNVKLNIRSEVASRFIAKLKSEEISLSSLFPKLKGVICWTKGPCQIFLKQVKALLDKTVVILDAGYLSSEFWGTIAVEPLEGHGVPTFTSYFFEFLPVSEDPKRNFDNSLALYELEKGHKYYIIVSSKTGLLRYHINDIIEVVDKIGDCPLISFVQKGEGVSNITGEKITEHQVIQAVRDVCSKFNLPSFRFVCFADIDELRYKFLFEETEKFSDEFESELEKKLSELNPEYELKRASGRLKECLVFKLKSDDYDVLVNTLTANIARKEQIKVPVLLNSVQVEQILGFLKQLGL